MSSEGRRSTDRVLRVLLYLAGQAQPVTAVAIAVACEIPRTTLYPMLTDMERANFLVHLEEDRTWALGVAVFEVGSAYLRSEPLQRLGRTLLVRLTERVNQTTHLAILHGNEALYLLKQAPARASPVLISDVGVRIPANLTAVGRAILMWLPDAQVLAIFPSNATFVKRTELGDDRLSDLRAVLREHRALGVSTESGMTTEDISCIAAPVFDHRRFPIASIGVSFRTTDVAESEWTDMVAAVRETADGLTERLHGVHPESHI